MDTKMNLETFVAKEQQGMYLTLPFEMPANTEVFSLRYSYERYAFGGSVEGSGFRSREEVNIIDLGLVDSRGEQVGASGSDKMEVEVSATHATPGYQPGPLTPGPWQILVGAYKVAPGGVRVVYELSFKPKHPRWFKGDLHTHTIASDGVLTVDELAWRARRHDLDYLAITDHNQMVSAQALPQVPGLSLIPGVEWTHFKGHASFLGVDKPYDEPFFTASFEQVQARFDSAWERGALITINHPFEEVCPFQFDLESIPWDCLEVWNGPMRESNLRALGLWQQLLVSGKVVPICGGSDYHRDQLFLFPGGPTTCIFAPSSSPADLLAGLRQGHAYLVYGPDGPSLEMTAGEAVIGDTVLYEQVSEVEIRVDHLWAGDVVQVVTQNSAETIFEAPLDGTFSAGFPITEPGFARVVVLRSFVPGLPLLPALLGNPIYIV